MLASTFSIGVTRAKSNSQHQYQSYVTDINEFGEVNLLWTYLDGRKTAVHNLKKNLRKLRNCKKLQAIFEKLFITNKWYCRQSHHLALINSIKHTKVFVWRVHFNNVRTIFWFACIIITLGLVFSYCDTAILIYFSPMFHF